MKKILSFVMALLLLTVALTACGGQKQNVKVIDIPLSEEQYAFAVSKDNTELLEQVNAYLKQIQEDGTFDEICDRYFGNGEPVKFKSATEDANKEQLVVATNAEFAPFEYKIGDQYAGIDMTIAKYIADTLGMELVIKDMDFDSVVTSVGSNGIDIAMAALTVNEKRKESVNFTESYYDAAQVVVVLAGNSDFDECETAEDVLAVFASKNS